MDINIILIIVLIILALYSCLTTNNIENFADFHSECILPDLLSKAAGNHGMNRNSKDWEYYFPCEYNSCEARIKQFETEVNDKKKIFIIDGCDWPASKMALWKLLKDVYTNDVAATIMPQTYLLDDQEDLKKIKKNYNKNLKIKKNFMYILKNYAQRQEGLKIVQNYDDIMSGYKNGFYLVQDYLYNPFLIENHKINFRYYTLIVCREGKVEGYIHKDGFVYYAPKVYDENNPDFNIHITTGYIDRAVYDTNPLTLDDFRNYLEKQKSGSSKIWDNNVNKLMHNVIKAVATKVCKNAKLHKHTLFQLFGSDVAPTKDLVGYLMEINKGPDLDAKDERDKKVKYKMQQDIFKVIDQVDEKGKPFTNNRFVRVF